MMTAWAQT